MKNLTTVILLVIMLAVLASLLLSGATSTRESAVPSQCRNNLKVICLALHSYCETYGTFPPAFVEGGDGRPAHSWRVLLLPFIDANDVYSQYRFDEPWNSTHNSRLAERMPPEYQCPGFPIYLGRQRIDRTETEFFTNYVAVTAPNAIFSGSRPTAIKDITDGTSNTLLIAEVRRHAQHWMQPVDVPEVDFASELADAKDEHRLHGEHGLYCVLADGTVRMLSPSLSKDSVHALVTRNAAETNAD